MWPSTPWTREASSLPPPAEVLSTEWLPQRLAVKQERLRSPLANQFGEIRIAPDSSSRLTPRSPCLIPKDQAEAAEEREVVAVVGRVEARGVEVRAEEPAAEVRVGEVVEDREDLEEQEEARAAGAAEVREALGEEREAGAQVVVERAAG